MYQEVVVDALVLKVMHKSREVGGQLLPQAQSLTLQHSTMTHQHVGHLHNRRHMDAAPTMIHVRPTLILVFATVLSHGICCKTVQVTLM